jgi:hypothetical protein
LGITEGGEIEAQKLKFVLQLAKPFFCLLVYIFNANKKWFLRNRIPKADDLIVSPAFGNTMLAAGLFTRQFYNCILKCLSVASKTMVKMHINRAL